MDPPEADNNVVETSPSFLNATLKAASRFFTLPSRLVARVRRLDDVLNADVDATTSAYAGTSSGNVQAPRNDTPSVGFAMEPLPGPLAFVTSGYFFGLFIMVSPAMSKFTEQNR